MSVKNVRCIYDDFGSELQMYVDEVLHATHQFSVAMAQVLMSASPDTSVMADWKLIEGIRRWVAQVMLNYSPEVFPKNDFDLGMKKSGNKVELKLKIGKNTIVDIEYNHTTNTLDSKYREAILTSWADYQFYSEMLTLFQKIVKKFDG